MVGHPSRCPFYPCLGGAARGREISTSYEPSDASEYGYNGQQKTPSFEGVSFNPAASGGGWSDEESIPNASAEASGAAKPTINGGPPAGPGLGSELAPRSLLGESR
jgi:hypothetical protein